MPPMKSRISGEGYQLSSMITSSPRSSSMQPQGPECTGVCSERASTTSFIKASANKGAAVWRFPRGLPFPEAATMKRFPELPAEKH